MTPFLALSLDLKATSALLAGKRMRVISSADVHELLLDVTASPEAELVQNLLDAWSGAAGEAISMADVEEMLRTGKVPANVMQALSQTTSAAVEEIRVQARGVARDMAAGWLRGVEGADLERIQALVTGEQDLHAAITSVLDQRAQNLAVELTDGQQAALDLAVTYYTETSPSTAAALAQRIGDFVGLTDRETQAVLNYRTGLAQEGLSGAGLDSRVAQYADLMEKRRALRIARTEMSYAATQGQHEAIVEARDQGLVIKTVYKRFVTSDDEAQCEICSALEGMTVGEDEDFGGEGEPPIHPNCRCSVDYIEITGEE